MLDSLESEGQLPSGHEIAAGSYSRFTRGRLDRAAGMGPLNWVFNRLR